MNKIHSVNSTIKLAQQLNKQKKKIVLAGGCFDILHLGHIMFFEQARKKGDHLMLLLENDSSVTHLKGSQRPINSQKNRAKVLAALTAVDSIALLPTLMNNKDYDSLVLRLKPAIIATTTGDPFRKQKEKQAKSVEGKVISIKKIKDHSTTKLAAVLSDQFAI